MSAYHLISTEVLTLPIIQDIISEQKQLKLSDEAKTRIRDCRLYLDEKLKKQFMV